MNYEPNLIPEVMSAGAIRFNHELKDELKRLLRFGDSEKCELLEENEVLIKPVERTSEDERLEFLGYNY